MIAAELKLERFALARLHLDCVEGEIKAGSDIGFQLAVESAIAGHEKDDHRFRIRLHVKSSPDKAGVAGYRIDAIIHGYFAGSGPVETNVGPYLRDGSALLYGALRGHIAMVTGAGEYGAFHLPTMLTSDFLKELKTRPARSRSEKPARQTTETRKAARKPPRK